jgi:hypothetical protein
MTTTQITTNTAEALAEAAGMTPAETTPVLYGYGWHDLTLCRCGRHCLNCGAELELRQRKYCSDYCGRRWRAELDLDRRLSAMPSVP